MYSTSGSLPNLSADDAAILERTSESPLIPAPDLLVIGAELTGLAAASFAAEKGWKVQVLSDSSLTETNSSRLPGLIWPSSLAGVAGDDEREFAFYCRDLWSRLTVRPGMEFEWKVPGVVALGGAKGIPGWSDRLEELQADGWSIQGIDAEQLQSLLPGWNRNEERGLFFPADGQINPLRASLSFARNLLSRKSSVRTGLTVQLDGSIAEGKISVVKTSLGDIRPKWVLFNDRNLPENLISVETTEQTIIRGFVPLTTQICNQPVVNDRTTIVPRSGGCEVFSLLDSAQDDAVAILQNAWNETVFRWTDPACGQLTVAAKLTRKIAQNRFPLLDRLPDVSNAWWTLPDSNDTLLAVGLGQRLLEWIQTGEFPSSLNFLQS